VRAALESSNRGQGSVHAGLVSQETVALSDRTLVLVFQLNGKSAVVTGAGSGIGRAIAELFAAQGARVLGVDVSEPGLEATSRSIQQKGGAFSTRHCDVTSAEEVAAAFEYAETAVGGVSILVNSAGIAHVGTAESTPVAEFDRVYQVNVKGLFLCSRSALVGMRSRGSGVIVNLASIASLIGLEDRFAYSMSKGAVLAMTRSIAVDYMRHGIRCNAICPARVHTPFVDDFLQRFYPGREAEMFEQLSSYQPLGRMARPEEVAALALYLCSDEAAFITGQAFPIDGGVLVK
jgi:NAD(P)-dependent dehydrogenase (short-subunit alcohol dehydrogenase family)